jgi:hypothetical protein
MAPTVCLVVLAALAAPGRAPEDEALTKEKQRLQGTWDMVALEVAGRSSPKRT